MSKDSGVSWLGLSIAAFMMIGGLLLIFAPDSTAFYRPTFNNGMAPHQDILENSGKPMIRLYGGVLLIFGLSIGYVSVRRWH